MELEAIRSNIRRLRKQAGITQKEIAAKLFIDERTYSKIERGEQKSMDIRFVAAVAAILQTEICTLLEAQQNLKDQTELRQEKHTHDSLANNDLIELEMKNLKEEIRALIACNKETMKLLSDIT